MDAAVVALGTACAYAGFQWTVRVLVYPQLATVGRRDPEGFPAYAAQHQRRISWVVGPLFLLLVGSTAWQLVAALTAGGAHGDDPAGDGPVAGGVRVGLALAAGACTAVVLAATAFGAVPQHAVLAQRWDAGAHRRLLRWDELRVAAATAQVLVAALVVLR